jgi:MinD superfamily P-loop ATPase
MKIAVLSGKGGTGKTLLSVNLAAAAGEAVYVDCDVEEPNGRLFFKPSDIATENVSVCVPEVDGERCAGCRRCVEFCRFNALAFVKNRPFDFDEVCHFCGGCILLCPNGALTERQRVIGEVESGTTGGVPVLTGILRTGEVSGVPIVKKLVGQIGGTGDRPVFIDCPPGSACIVMESIREADFCVLAAEPTVFGVSNLAMAYELVRLFDKRHGVVLNKCLDGDNPAERFCKEKGIPILGKIPYDTELGSLSADAEIAAAHSEKYRALFSDLLDAVNREVGV